MASLTVAEILDSQVSLLREAAEALPHQFSQCTYALGHIRQAVYLCRTCDLPRGICSACSVACHTDHEQLELFPKRNFRCDCPTSALPHQCSLHTMVEDANTDNVYGQNFTGVFCRCGREYNAQEELETMIQCLECEDWFHESCLNLRERPSSRAPSPEPLKGQPGDNESAANSNVDNDDAQSDASSSGLPPPLITAADYDAFVCGTCVRSIDTLRRYAGTPGVLMVVRDSPQAPWKTIGQLEQEGEVVNIGAEEAEVTNVNVGTKRPRSESISEAQNSKRPRASSDTDGKEDKAMPTAAPCLAPAPNGTAQAVLRSLDERSSGGTESLGAGDVFLTDGWRDRWCRCNSCMTSLLDKPYLLEEEETYEPPEDPESNMSLEELGLRALQRIPRERAINGIHAFNEMRDQLMFHLRPFAEQDKEVTEADIRSFFEATMAKRVGETTT